ncbi:helix-turn-helix transcriptional regulator [Mucilaginibacter rubeus]|uniref:Helix-turn-helix domain-containing protein n=1 Tax=Mucilaginibacter rubeus TaxID=2027860 RepID=A0AAE6JDT5_9SPHI|nr:MULTISPECIES: AraC family transcriptional regulator [Mucilaginibacter]QEM03778.1 helix-turn-helix transcriptional regulator [Mucilaginibacter rubeus]QEM16390.1 helix-turn-helix transcriptional regulator [Mucilaginibacter gossypii]QTE40843.1 helix-turn-helix domain-containing protein [Mucilaginibacter rubeus]QTE47446.1 helix-turn-helix domain-containing protein [Mucilaginibacter rubeus]QTE58839.1 helix-turn-helix domain-containing protein [Mucilaginibacter rubeus]
MKGVDVFREITPLTQADCFLLFDRNKKRFDFPVHRHKEMELNLILNAAGAKRVIGDHSAEVSDSELVLTGPGLKHGWLNHHCKSDQIREITIQFHEDILGEAMLNRDHLNAIKIMFQASVKGIVFLSETINEVSSQIVALSGKSGFDSVVGFLKILHQLSLSPYKCLCDAEFVEKDIVEEVLIEKALSFINEHYQQQLTFTETAKAVNLPDDLFSRMLKRSTGLTFNDCLARIRLGHVSRLLIENNYPVGEIAYRCGFNNLTNFHRIFKLKKLCTPKQFREKYSGNRLAVY